MPPTFTRQQIESLSKLDIHKHRPFLTLTDAELKKELVLSRKLYKEFKNRNPMVNIITQRVLQELLKRN